MVDYSFGKVFSVPPREPPTHEEPVRTTEPSKLQCEICGMVFKNHSALERHMEHAHGNPERTHTHPHL
jgi:hypothetical protein